LSFFKTNFKGEKVKKIGFLALFLTGIFLFNGNLEARVSHKKGTKKHHTQSHKGKKIHKKKHHSKKNHKKVSRTIAKKDDTQIREQLVKELIKA